MDRSIALRGVLQEAQKLNERKTTPWPARPFATGQDDLPGGQNLLHARISVVRCHRSSSPSTLLATIRFGHAIYTSFSGRVNCCLGAFSGPGRRPSPPDGVSAQWSRRSDGEQGSYGSRPMVRWRRERMCSAQLRPGGQLPRRGLSAPARPETWRNALAGRGFGVRE